MNNTNTLINLKTLCTTLACLAPPLICAQPAAPLGGDPGNPSQLPTNRDLLPSRITNSPNSPLEFLNERNSNQDSASQRAIGRYTYRITRTDPNKNRDSFFGWELPAGFDRVDLRLFTPSILTFIDLGSQAEGEISLFENGNLSATVELVTLRFTNELWRKVPQDHERLHDLSVLDTITYKDAHGNEEKRLIENWYHTRWNFGAEIAGGIAGVTTDQGNSSSALILTYGVFTEYEINEQASVNFRFGGVYGVSFDDSLDSTTRDDSGLYLGIGLDFSF